MPERVEIPEDELREVAGILTYEEIGNIYGCSKTTVSQRVKEYGLNEEIPIRSMIHAGKASWHRGLNKQTDKRLENMGRGISMALSGKPKSKTHLKNWCKARKGHNVSEETREKLRRIHTGRASPKRGKSYLDMYGEEKANDITERWLNSCRAAPNNAEMYLREVLDNLFPGDWRFVGDGKLVIGGRCPDFKHNNKGLLIELFGDYWHDEKDIEIRRQHFNTFRFDVIFIWEHELFDTNLIYLRIKEWYDEQA